MVSDIELDKYFEKLTEIEKEDRHQIENLVKQVEALVTNHTEKSPECKELVRRLDDLVNSLPELVGDVITSIKNGNPAISKMRIAVELEQLANESFGGYDYDMSMFRAAAFQCGYTPKKEERIDDDDGFWTGFGY
jgi:hypothetical protein